MKPARRILKHFLMTARSERLSTSVYASMVDQLFGSGSTVGYMMLVVAATILTLVAYHNNPNAVTGTILAIMLLIAAGRILLLVKYRRWRKTGVLKVTAIARWEYDYCLLGFAMALVIGVVSAYTTIVDREPNTLIISIIVTMGVAGGVTTRNGSRPQIVFAQIAAVMIPFCAALAATGARESYIVAFLFGIYFLSTYLSTKAFYKSLRNAMANEARNLSLKKSVQRTATMFDTALNNMRSGVMMFDEKRRLVVANDALKDMFDAKLIDDLVGKNDSEIVPAVFAMLGTRPQEGEVFLKSLRRAFGKNRNDPVALTDHTRRRVYDLRGRIMQDRTVVLTIDDVTEKRTREAEIHRLAHHDVLTGLPNRFSLGLHIDMALTQASVDLPLVVAFLDLDNFKSVNDDLGHGAGDAMLVQVAERINRAKRGSDFAARIAGDEFVLVFEHVTQVAAIEKTVERIIGSLSQPYALSGRMVQIGASAGMAIARGQGLGSEELMRLADVALYEAKTSGRGQAFWFDAAMDERARNRRELTADLKAAIDEGKLTLVYQPIVDHRTGSVVCCEALCRWHHPTRGPISPVEFIPLAEESGLIQRLGLWTVRQACVDAARWQDSETKVAVNLSLSQFKSGGLSAAIADIFAETGFPPARMEFEITESVLAEDLESIAAQLSELKALGVSLALDDFGTGYSNLSYLHSLPIEKLKLDRSFIIRLDRDPTSLALIASIVQMAQVLRKELVIEGVETAAQLAMIASAQGRLVQGFYFSRPLPQAGILDYLAQNNSKSALLYRESA